MNWPLFVSLAATVAASAYLAYEARTYVRRNRRAETGATVGWSPAQEFSATQYELTPVEMLDHEPPTAAVLADGSAVVLSGQPTEEALTEDTHHVMDLRWEIMLAEFRTNMDAIIAALGEPATVGA